MVPVLNYLRFYVSCFKSFVATSTKNFQIKTKKRGSAIVFEMHKLFNATGLEWLNIPEALTSIFCRLSSSWLIFVYALPGRLWVI